MQRNNYKRITKRIEQVSSLIKSATIRRKKRIALIAHDNKKEDMLQWAKYNCDLLEKHDLYATGTTGLLLEKELGLNIHVLESVHGG